MQSITRSAAVTATRRAAVLLVLLSTMLSMLVLGSAGTASASDYASWQSNFGATAQASTGGGAVTPGDYLIWQRGSGI